MEAKTAPKTPWTSLGGQERSRNTQELPKIGKIRVQGGSKKGPRAAKELPRGVREGPSATFWTHWVLEGTLKSLLLAPNQHKMLKGEVWERGPETAR